MSASDHDATNPVSDARTHVAFTYSLPVQKLDASLANQTTTPRSSSGRPMRPIGFKLDHLSRSCGCLSMKAAVILFCGQFISYSK